MNGSEDIIDRINSATITAFICSDGSIGGFYGNRSGEMIEKKKRLLEEENKQLKEYEKSKTRDAI